MNEWMNEGAMTCVRKPT